MRFSRYSLGRRPSSGGLTRRMGHFPAPGHYGVRIKGSNECTGHSDRKLALAIHLGPIDFGVRQTSAENDPEDRSAQSGATRKTSEFMKSTKMELDGLLYILTSLPVLYGR